MEEIQDNEALFQLTEKFYASAEAHRAEVEQIIETVHRHTLAVELAARLLETGILEPREVLDKLREQHAAFDASDKINISKDGKSKRATYYDHIHTLFALFGLPELQRSILRNLSLIPLTGIPARLFGKWMGFRDLNDINEAVEMGLVQAKAGRYITLHPMIREVAMADLPPSIENCHNLLESIRFSCQHHGEDISYYGIMFQTVENAIDFAAKDDRAFYLLVLEDVFQYMEKYRYEGGMKRIIDEMEVLLSDIAIGSDKDRALLLDCRAACEKNTQKAIKLEKDALGLLQEVTEENALLVSNLNANLGALYHTAKTNDLALAHMKTAMDILEEYGLIGYHDSIMQYINYAVLLADTGDPERALTGLRKIERLIRVNGDVTGDHAELLETMGSITLVCGDIPQGTDYLKRAMEIYEELWSDNPQLVEEKRQEIQTYYTRSGVSLAKSLINRRRLEM